MREGKEAMLRFSDVAELFRAIRRREEGQTMAEYSVTLAVICIATVAVFAALGGSITGEINKVAGLLP
jgi:Flp pilus assembly pilin Flp